MRAGAGAGVGHRLPLRRRALALRVQPEKGQPARLLHQSPDPWDRADFKGPRAKLDWCYEDHVRGKEACDQSLRHDINCGFAFNQDGDHKDRDKFETCHRMAAGDHGWVTREGDY